MASPHRNGHSTEFLASNTSFSFARARDDDDDDEDEETRCGWGPIRSPFLQKLANKNSYLLVYSFLGIFQSMFFSYSIATLTTLEKQFKLNSQTTGTAFQSYQQPVDLMVDLM